MSYSDSPHCGDDLHSAAGATHLQTADVLQNDKERFKGALRAQFHQERNVFTDRF